jgi:hypothetical protein
MQRPRPPVVSRSRRAQHCVATLALAVLALTALTLASTSVAQPPRTSTAAGTMAPVSAHFLAEAIVRNGAFTSEECPPSSVAEPSTPGCARIPAPVETAKRWLDLIEEAVFHETTRIGAWASERALTYVVWRLEPTGQRYLLVLAPHPHVEQTILYVSELPQEAAAVD